MQNSAETIPIDSLPKSLNEALSKQLDKDEKVIYWQNGSRRPFFFFLFGIFICLFIIFWIHYKSIGQDYLGLLQHNFVSPIDFFKLAIPLLIVWLCLDDSYLIVLTDKRLMYFWLLPILIALLLRKGVIFHPIDLLDISSVYTRWWGDIDTVIVKSKSQKQLFLRGVHNRKELIEGIKSAAGIDN